MLLGSWSRFRLRLHYALGRDLRCLASASYLPASSLHLTEANSSCWLTAATVMWYPSFVRKLNQELPDEEDEAEDRDTVGNEADDKGRQVSIMRDHEQQPNKTQNKHSPWKQPNLHFLVNGDGIELEGPCSVPSTTCTLYRLCPGSTLPPSSALHLFFQFSNVL